MGERRINPRLPAILLSTARGDRIESFVSITGTKRRTLLPWMGGKSKSADRIISILPVHTTYIEAFCGGGAVFFRKPRSKAEIINDADNRLITLLRVMRYHPDELLRELGCLAHSRQEFKDALAQPGITDIQRAARFLMVLRVCFGANVSRPTFGYSKTAPANFTQEGIQCLIDAARDRLSGVTIENLDFEEVIDRYDHPEALIYCDPPYIGTADYTCKFTMDDHRRLRDRLCRIQGKAVVSLNDCPQVRDLYRGWNIEELSVTYSVGGKGADRGKGNGEVLMMR